MINAIVELIMKYYLYFLIPYVESQLNMILYTIAVKDLKKKVELEEIFDFIINYKKK